MKGVPDKALAVSRHLKNTQGVSESFHQKSLLMLLPAAGETLVIRKVQVHAKNSQVQTGTVMRGLLKEKIAIGKPIVFRHGGGTSEVTGVSLASGVIMITTRTSTYRVEQDRSPEQTIQLLKTQKHRQPESTKRVLEDTSLEFVHEQSIGGHRFLFTARSAGKVLALVETCNGVFVPRGFRYSESDVEWKSLPAYRNESAYSKGREGEPGHHYVQDTKLDERLKHCIQALPEKPSSHVSLRQYLPILKRGHGRAGQFTEDFTLGEEQKLVYFADPEWRKCQEDLQRVLAWYEKLNFSWGSNARTFARYDLQGNESDFSRMLTTFRDTFFLGGQMLRNYEELLQEYNRICASVPADALRKTNFRNPLLRDLQQKYKKCFGYFFHTLFETMPFPADFLPDFSKNPLDVRLSSDGTRRRRYNVKSRSGDAVIWTVADDPSGNRWVDDIAENHAVMTSYGTRRNMYNMGILIYKPFDYSDQTIALLENDLGPVGDRYRNINRLWRLLKPLR